MNSLVYSQSRNVSDVNSARYVPSPEARKLMRFGNEQGWEFALLGRAPLPATAIRLKDWLLVPVSEDSSVIPQRALERVQAIYAAGLRPQGFVVAHEAPRRLAAPQSTLPQSSRMSSIATRLRESFRLTDEAHEAISSSLYLLGRVAAMAVLSGLSVLMVSALTLDPILVAVTEDGYWLEIDRWWN